MAPAGGDVRRRGGCIVAGAAAVLGVSGNDDGIVFASRHEGVPQVAHRPDMMELKQKRNEMSERVVWCAINKEIKKNVNVAEWPESYYCMYTWYILCHPLLE